MKQTASRYTITVCGDSEGAKDDALREACRAINEGHHSGHNSNHEGAYYFESTDNVPKKEWPA